MNKPYLRAVRALASRIEPGWVSDHLCWTGVRRRGLDVLFEKLEAAERKALRLARRGGAFADVYACAPDTLPGSGQAAWAVHLVQRWVARGWIVGLVAP